MKRIFKTLFVKANSPYKKGSTPSLSEFKKR